MAMSPGQPPGHEHALESAGLAASYLGSHWSRTVPVARPVPSHFPMSTWAGG